MTDNALQLMEPLGPSGTGGSNGRNPLQMVHGVMRGRYIIAAVLAALFACTAGWMSYRRVELVYQTTGSIRFRSYMPKLLYGTELSGKMPNFDEFVNAQMQLIKNERVVDMAMGSEEWRKLARPFTPETQRAFRDNLSIHRSNGSDTIAISFRDPDQHVTQVAVKAVMEAYQRLFNETDPTQERRRMQLLDSRRLTLTKELESLRKEIQSFGDAYGAEGVQFRYQKSVSDLRALEESIRDTKIDLVAARQQEEVPPPVPSIDQLTAQNPRLAMLTSQVKNLEARISLLTDKFGESHIAVTDLKSRIADLQKQIDDEIAGMDVTTNKDDWQHQRQREVKRLEVRLTELDNLLDAGKEQLSKVSKEIARLDELKNEAKDKEDKLAQVESRIEQLNVESSMGDRLEVLTYGQPTQQPVNQNEPMQKAKQAGMAGAAIGIGLVMLFGFINPKLRRSADLSSAGGGLKVLGMLPHLPDQLKSPEQAYFAGQCVHQIRMFLQLEGGGEDLHSFVVTGPTAGTGKTSLTIALGLSYAAAGSKTLLVDFDMIGGGLTYRLGATRRKRLARLLEDAGLVSAAVIEKMPGDPSTDEQLAEKLLAHDMISYDDVRRVEELQRKSRSGLLDVMGGKSLQDCITELDVPDLTLLSLGNAAPEHVSRIGRAAVKRFLKDASKIYDTILIDTGPVPGSVEASLVAAEADRVVLAVSRGDQMRRLNECLEFLRSVKASIAGLVFNRAEQRDMARSAYSYSSQRSVRQIDEDDQFINGRLDSPLAAAVKTGSAHNGRS